MTWAFEKTTYKTTTTMSSSRPFGPPVVRMDRVSDRPFSPVFLADLVPLLAKTLEWTFFFLLGCLGFGWSWVLLLAMLHCVRQLAQESNRNKTELLKMSALSCDEKEVLGRSLDVFPAWVGFPDFDRCEWLNETMAQLWRRLANSGLATRLVIDYVQPELARILDQLRLKEVSGFNVSRVDLGTIPARVGGIKTYKSARQGDRGMILLDVEVAYDGDARVVFTLQGVQAEIKQIVFKGVARVALKPLLDSFPFLGGFQMCLLYPPVLEYTLGGVGAFGDLPGASAIVRKIVEEQIRARLVWPNKVNVSLPIEAVEEMEDTAFLLTRPVGILTVQVVEARNLLRKDKNLTGSGKSDPYAVVSLGSKRVSFRDSYVPKTVDPQFDYSTQFVVEDNLSGLQVKVELFDHDTKTADDFLGSRSIEPSSASNIDEWLKLEDVDKGEVRVRTLFDQAEALDDVCDLDAFDTFIVSLLIDSCKDLVAGQRQRPIARCIVTHTQGEKVSTRPAAKGKDPVFEECFTFVSKSLDTDALTVQVVDSRNDSAQLGSLKLPLAFLKRTPRREFFHMQWQLEGGNGAIVLSAKCFGTCTLDRQ